MAQLVEPLDFVNMMTYDFHGAWESNSNHQSALYQNPNDPNAIPGANYTYTTDSAIQYLLERNVPSRKIVVGLPFYGRGWQAAKTDIYATVLDTNAAPLWDCNDIQPDYIDADGVYHVTGDEISPLFAEVGRTYGQIGEPDMNSIHFMNEGASGVYDYWKLMELYETKDAILIYDDIAQASLLCVNENIDKLYSFDIPAVTEVKMQYITDMSLGGAMFWSIDGDADNDSTNANRNHGDQLLDIIARNLNISNTPTY